MRILSSSNQIFVISAPSGAGKTSLVDALLNKDTNIVGCTSHTTRPLREGEINGENYHFVDDSEFMKLIKNNQFIEYANVFGFRYGTSELELEKTLNAGLDVILEIDWQGAEQVRNAYNNCSSIFILPPSLSALEERLRSRGKDTAEVIKARSQEAAREIKQCDNFDYVIVNDDFNKALQELVTIINAVRLETGKQRLKLASLLRNLLPDE
tara:strand:- start:915 stop:1547 length:633 start_codon:yes stop_codon:yes gene_type:complete